MGRSYFQLRRELESLSPEELFDFAVGASNAG